MHRLTIAVAITAAMALATSFAPPAQSAAGLGAGTLALPAPSSPIVPAACRGRGLLTSRIPLGVWPLWQALLVRALLTGA